MTMMMTMMIVVDVIAGNMNPTVEGGGENKALY